MKKYIFMRTLRSLVSIFLVTTLTYAIIYTLVPSRLIFLQDPNYNKMVTTPDKKVNYENTVFEKTGYIEYYNSKELQQKASKMDSSVNVAVTDKNKAIYKKYIKSLGKGWKLHQFKTSKAFYATRKISVVERVVKFYANLFVIDHPWKVQDPSNPNLKRYIHIENDTSAGLSVVGSGTTHKYLLYFNTKFPYIHQNFVTLNLGNSYPTYANIPVLQVITQGQGKAKATEVKFPKGQTKVSPIDIYSRTYKSPKNADALDKANFGANDAYTATKNNFEDPSMITNSFIAGIIGIVISYAVGLPIGLFMARFKDKVSDNVLTAIMTFLLAVPSIAIIYVLRYFGSKIGFADTFPSLGAHDWRSYAAPGIILGVLNIPGIVIWFRRYLVDLQGSDFVRFARAKGLSESEISKKHLFKHAMVPVISGIPASIILTITGATLTETVFAFPGMGKMLIDSIRAANNSMVVGLVFVFTVLSIFSLLVGDICMTILDPRIKLSSKKGGN
ncbi:MAG: ABC transporter permease [Streptococcus sp.]|nr:ABC transporter permease [Streptococcus sp.]